MANEEPPEIGELERQTLANLINLLQQKDVITPEEAQEVMKPYLDEADRQGFDVDI